MLATKWYGKYPEVGKKIIKRETECYCLTRNVLRYINRSLIPRTDGGLFFFKGYSAFSFLENLSIQASV